MPAYLERGTLSGRWHIRVDRDTARAATATLDADDRRLLAEWALLGESAYDGPWLYFKDCSVTRELFNIATSAICPMAGG